MNSWFQKINPNCFHMGDSVCIIEPGDYLHKWPGKITGFPGGQVEVLLDRWKRMSFPFSQVKAVGSWEEYDAIT